ncbi:hypothetical protein [Pedobacter punctiformis]|uniref:Transposase n=1 Tax=Pedobacter punctiformis TaxID=3004097 RepID=A0ABT4LAL9_9SPHI|nr:hypothetical protein [Pedobacter sp. HCMS5-2]MCZ4244965.1 hypothetical protein [Pedobacter sp. HCMS5-2]
MENTLENKIKFFVLHYGQDVAIQGEGGGSGFSYPITYHILDQVYDSYLRLKPLSSITDEDGIEVRKHLHLKPNTKANWTLKDLVDLLKEKHGINSLHVYDYLRSKGYALPYMGISVEKQIEYGWIKLKEGL